jgi:hypothetical protein
VLFSRGLRGFFVTGVNVPRHAESRIVREHTIQTLCGFVSAVGHGHLSGVQ